MKKRVLSAFMALALCLTLLPTAALADELGPVDGTSTVETAGADAEAAAKAEAEAAAKAEAEAKAKAEAEAKAKAEAEAKAKAGAEAVATVQELIDALPDEPTEENAEDVSAKLGEIDAAMAALGDEERAALDLTQYQAAIAALAALAAAQGEIALYADDTNKPHNGKGTTEDPYQITSTDEMEWFRDTVNAGNTKICAKLMNDLNFDNKQNDSLWTWTPIGNSEDNAYVGMFDGNGYEIKEIRLVDVQAQSHTNRGLFGWIGTGGKVQDLAVSVKYVGNSSLAVSDSGLLSVNNAGTIERCSATISNALYTDSFGMIAYENRGEITDCLSYVNATGNKLSISGKAAGIARTNTGTISNCFFRGSFRTGKTDYAIAENKNGSITNCYYRDANNGRNGEVYIDGNKDTGATVVWKSTSECNSGEVAWLLNNSGSRDTWRMGSNKYPSLKKTDGRVNKNQDGSYNIGDKPHMHGDVEFTKVAALSDIKATGNYYIDAAVNVDRTWEVSGDVVLCLDGQTVTAKDAIAPAIKVSGSNSLTLLACKEGKITGSGGTSILVDSGDLTLGGKAQVTGNDKNILLAQGSEISFDSLDPSAKFGISVEGQDAMQDGDRVAVTDTTGGRYFAQLVADGFKNDGLGFELYLSDDGKTVMLGRQSKHTHCICGDSSKDVNGHTHETGITFQPWAGTNELPTSGNYYLTRNVTLTKSANLQSANICLNGYTVTLSDVGRINPSGTTQLTDCSVDGKGKLESYPGKANGGVAISGGSKFYLYGGTLNGVKVEIGQTGGGTFNMYGGKITGNTQGTVVGQSKTGGNPSAITINMYGGEISGNHISGSQGGGVFVGSGSQFNMYGGKIINNTTTADGGGVYVASADNAYSAGTMTIRGDAVIQDNEANGVTNNVSLPSGNQITISGTLRENAKIGVTTKAGPSAGTVNIATATDTGWVAAKNFTSDKSAYHVGLVNDGKTVQLQVHSHQWEYSVNGTTIMAKCTAENCDLADSNGGSVKIVAPSGSLIYDGNKHTATVNKSKDWQGEAVDASTIVYKKEGDATFTGNPKDAGTYTASIALTNGDGSTATASVEYTIAQAKLTMTGTPAATASYNENLAVKDIPITGLSVTFNGTAVNGAWKFDSDAKPEVGDTTAYTATFKPESGTYNYETLTTQIVPTITKGTYNGAAMTTTKNVLAGEAQTGVEVTTGLMPNITDAKIVEATEASDLNNIIENVTHTDNTVKFDVNNVSGDELTATITVTYSSKNYENFTSTITVKTVKKDSANVTITGLPQTVTYGQEFTLTASQTGDTTGANKKWTWDYDQEYFKRVGPNANTETITLQAIKASTPSKDITATYESGTHKGSATVNAVVEKKEVTVTAGSYKVSKTYDGTTNAGTATGELNVTGILSADSGVTVKVTPVAYTSANVGGQTSMNVSIALDGTGKDNYKIKNGATTVSVPCEVTKAMLTVEGTGTASGTYGDKLSGLTVSGLTARRNDTVVPGTWRLTGNTVPNVGDNGTYTATFTPESGVDNYDALTKDGVTLNITKAAYGNQSVSGSAKYGTTGSVDLSRYLAAGGSVGTITTADSEKVLSGDPVMEGNSLKFTFVNDASKANKMATITVPVTGATNYESYTITVTVTVNDKTTPMVTAPTAKAGLVYNGADQVLIDAGSTTGGTLQYKLDNGTYGTELPKAKNAGTYTVYYKVIGNDGYADVPENSVSVSVAKRAISVKADNKSMTANGTLPTFTVTYGNLPSGVQAVDIFGTLASASTTTDGKTTGSFDITVTTPVLKTEAGANYEVGAVTKGTLTVNPRSSSGGGGGSSVSTYSVTVGKTDNGSVSVSPKSASKGDTVTVTVTPDKGYTLETLTVLDKNGKELKLTEKNGKYTFTMPAGKVEVKVTFMDDNTMLNYFVDVKAGDYFYDAVKWAAEKGITSGTDATHFGPNAACTRAQIVTFLWRTAGSPEPKSTGSFADVPTDSYYAKAVAWAVENGITGGTGDGKFSPNATCTREQAVAFLYRASGSPAVSGGSAFNDVAANAYYADAVAWAEKNEITGGIGGGLFGSGNDCTRAQIVTFLYRTYQGK